MSKTYIQEKLIGEYGQIVSFDSNKNAILTSPNLYGSITLVVYASASTQVTVSDEYSSYIQTVASGANSTIFNLPRLGTWKVISTLNDVSSVGYCRVYSTGSYSINMSSFKSYINFIFNSGVSGTEVAFGAWTGGNPPTFSNNDFISDTSGYRVFSVSEVGTYRIMVRIDSKSNYVDVPITQSGVSVNYTCVVDMSIPLNISTSTYGYGSDSMLNYGSLIYNNITYNAASYSGATVSVYPENTLTICIAQLSNLYRGTVVVNGTTVAAQSLGSSDIAYSYNIPANATSMTAQLAVNSLSNPKTLAWTITTTNS